MKKNIIRKSVTLPMILDNKITLLADEYSYKVKNDLIVELLELGIIKYTENNELKNVVYTLINKVDLLLTKLENK